MNAAASVAVIVAAVAMFIAARRRRSRRRPGAPNRCEHCGFAALPSIWQRCPACGENL